MCPRPARPPLSPGCEHIGLPRPLVSNLPFDLQARELSQERGRTSSAERGPLSHHLPGQRSSCRRAGFILKESEPPASQEEAQVRPGLCRDRVGGATEASRAGVNTDQLPLLGGGKLRVCLLCPSFQTSCPGCRRRRACERVRGSLHSGGRNGHLSIRSAVTEMWQTLRDTGDKPQQYHPWGFSPMSSTHVFMSQVSETILYDRHRR